MKELWPGWETVEAIGSGGFAQVYKIRKKDTGDGRDYYSALKIISIPQSPSEYAAYLGEGYDDATITAIFTNQVKRIEDEFHLMSQFKGNSNVVSYEDHMIVPHEDGKGWDILIRMELLTSLTAYCGSHAMTEEDTVNLGIGICHALELCEKKNIIHRDIKPQNIFVNEFGDYKLGDFGIAKSMDHTTQATKTGTYTYMAPEVYRGESYGATVDIYSLGLVLYWLLNERRMPFLPLPPTAPTATQIEESRSKRLAGAALPPPKNGSDALKSIVLKACAFRSADRYADPTAMRRDLERAKAMLVGGVLFGATETTVGIYADRTVSIAGAAGADRTVGIFGDGTAPTRREEADPGVPVAAASDGSGEGTVYITPPPATEDGGSGKGKLYAIIAAIAVIVIVVIILLLRGCGGEGDGVSTTTTWGDDDEPVITTDDEAPITTAPITTAPVTDAPEPSTHEHVLPSEGWQSDGASHWYVCACGEIAEKADHAYGEWEVTKEATESANGEKTRTCSVCSFTETDTIPMKAHEHSYATEWSDNETSHWHACACGEKEDLAAHSFGEWKITKAATETTTGTRERRCVVCDHLEKGTVPVLSHVHSFTGSFVKNETSHWHECACGEKADVSSHTFG
ncbi:MAG: serine/threonine protein kinase, partial [Clostridia bacterium]|nr:serine/threonine protein kinase [Clostridia bacterium]